MHTSRTKSTGTEQGRREPSARQRTLRRTSCGSRPLENRLGLPSRTAQVRIASARVSQWRCGAGKESDMIRKLLIIGTLVSVVGGSALAQVKRTPLQTVEFPPGFTTVTAIFEIAPGACAGRHTHPGLETSYLLEGEAVIKVAGQPDQKVKAGESFHIPPGAPHDACSSSAQGFKGIGAYVVE